MKNTTQHMMHGLKPDSAALNEQNQTEENLMLEEDEMEAPRALTHPSYEELEGKLNETESLLNAQTEALEKSKTELLHARADLDNARKRAAKDVSDAHQYALQKFITELLSGIDSLESGLNIDVGDNEFAKRVHEGLEMTLSKFLNILKQFHVTQIDPLGNTFDPALHQAISMQEDPKAEPNTVVQVLQKGYRLHDRLIRPALVVVAK